jgi:hypothetical protein
MNSAVMFYQDGGGLGWVETTKTGPNDVRRIVRALGVSFFPIVFPIYLLIISISIYGLKACRRLGWAVMMKMGHWYAFPFSLHVFLILISGFYSI